MLQDWGIVHAIVYDVCTHSVLMLVPLDSRLSAVVWRDCNQIAAMRFGLPDLCVQQLPPLPRWLSAAQDSPSAQHSPSAPACLLSNTLP